MFPQPERLLHQVAQIFGDLGLEVVFAEDLVHAFTGSELDVGDTILVP